MKMFHSTSVTYFITTIICSLTCVTIFSCKKDTGPPNPIITLISPLDTTVINAGDTILIEGTVSDNKSLHEVYITFLNTSADSILILNDHPYTHGAKNYTFNYIWYPSSPSVYKLKVEVHDHDENISSKEFLLTVN